MILAQKHSSETTPVDRTDNRMQTGSSEAKSETETVGFALLNWPSGGCFPSTFMTSSTSHAGFNLVFTGR